MKKLKGGKSNDELPNEVNCNNLSWLYSSIHNCKYLLRVALPKNYSLLDSLTQFIWYIIYISLTFCKLLFHLTLQKAILNIRGTHTYYSILHYNNYYLGKSDVSVDGTTVEMLWKEKNVYLIITLPLWLGLTFKAYARLSCLKNEGLGHITTQFHSL